MGVDAYEYLVVPFQGVVKSGQSSDVVSDQLQERINEYANKGWDFHSLGSVTLEIKPGCLSALFGVKSDYARHDQLVFRKRR